MKTTKKLYFILNILRAVLGINIILRKKRRADHKRILSLRTIKERFEEIYKLNIWDSYETKSGVGSSIKFTTPLRNWLINNVPKRKIEIIVDAPCGDFNWMQRVTSIIDVNYIGLDIVESLIKRNISLYSNENTSFSVADICNDKLPKCDLLIVRDVLFHFSYQDVDNFLVNLSKIDYRYLLTTNYIVPNDFLNRDISTAAFRVINLFSSPFNFDKNNVADRIYEGIDANIPRELVLIEKKYVPKDLEGNHKL